LFWESSDPRLIVPFPASTTPEKYTKWRPSGKNCGLIWNFSCRDLSMGNTGWIAPPSDEIRYKYGLCNPGAPKENKMTPRWLHVPPPNHFIPSTSVRVTGIPPVTSIFLIFVFAEKTTNRLSG